MKLLAALSLASLALGESHEAVTDAAGDVSTRPPRDERCAAICAAQRATTEDPSEEEPEATTAAMRLLQDATTEAPEEDEPECRCRKPTGGMEFKVLGQSGKMTFEKRGDKDSRIVVEMDGLKEVAEDGVTAVGVGGSGKHSFRSFATQEFEVSDMEESEYQGIRAYKVEFDATINGGEFKVNIYLMLDSGTIVNGDEEIEVNAGEFKFTVEVNDWAWCNGATSGDVNDFTYCAKPNGSQEEFGHFLDFSLAISSRTKPAGGKLGKRPPKEGGKVKPAVIDLGDGQALTLSTKVQVGGEWQDMPGADAEENYFPAVDTKGKAVIYTFRFPKSDAIFYDPGVDMGVSEEEFLAALAAEEEEIASGTTAAADGSSDATTTAAADDNDDTDDGMDGAAGSNAAAASVAGALALLMAH